MPAWLGQPQPKCEPARRCFALPGRNGDSGSDVRQRYQPKLVLDLEQQLGLFNDFEAPNGWRSPVKVVRCARSIAEDVVVRLPFLAEILMVRILSVSFRQTAS
jgi:hypothetical protein